MTPRSMTVDRGPLRVVAAYDGRARSELYVYIGGAETPAVVDYLVLADPAARARVVAALEALDPEFGPAAKEALVELARHVAADRTARGDGAGAEALAGHAVACPEIEPWLEPVELGTLLEQLVTVLRQYVSFAEDSHPVAIALWVAFTHVLEAFAVAPRLALTSPAKRCGKTTLLALLRPLVRRGIPTANISPAALFRLVERRQPTLLIDEADSAFERAPELRELVNAGHYRATGYVFRVVGEDQEEREFSVFAPLAIGLIGRLPDTVADRSITIPMRRKAAADRVTRLRLDRLEREVGDLARKLRRWALDTTEALRELDPEVPEGLHDRAADNWRPLLAIAELAGGPWPDRAREAARAIERAAEDEDVRTLLLADIRDVFIATGAEWIPSAELLERLVALQERPWAEWRHGRPMTPAALARQLHLYGIRSRQRGIGPKTERDFARGYDRKDLEAVWARYLPAEGVFKPPHPHHPKQDNDLGDSSNRHTAPGVADRKEDLSPCRTTGDAGVADRKGESPPLAEPDPPPVTLSAPAPGATPSAGAPPTTVSAPAGGDRPPAADLGDQVLALAERVGWAEVHLEGYRTVGGDEGDWRTFARGARGEKLARALEQLRALARAVEPEPDLDEEARRALGGGA